MRKLTAYRSNSVFGDRVVRVHRTGEGQVFWSNSIMLSKVRASRFQNLTNPFPRLTYTVSRSIGIICPRDRRETALFSAKSIGARSAGMLHPSRPTREGFKFPDNNASTHGYRSYQKVVAAAQEGFKSRLSLIS